MKFTSATFNNALKHLFHVFRVYCIATLLLGVIVSEQHSIIGIILPDLYFSSLKDIFEVYKAFDLPL